MKPDTLFHTVVMTVFIPFTTVVTFVLIVFQAVETTVEIALITVEITDFTKEGEGIGHADGYTLFVKDAVIGDRILARITKTKKSYGYARV